MALTTIGFRRLTEIVTAATVFVLIGSAPVMAQAKPGAKLGKGAQVEQTAGPDYLEIVTAKGERSRVALAAIKQASSGPIQRGGAPFPFTPLLAVMKLAGIPEGAQIRVTGTGGNPNVNQQMFLGKGANYEPREFGFIFNRRGRPVLTPQPGTRHASAEITAERPQVVDVTTITVVGR